MDKLESVSREALQEALDDIASGKAAKRLMIVLAYKDGASVETLSKRYDIPRSTVYYWLDRFEEMPIGEAIEDEKRPRRPPELTRDEREQLQSEVEQPPQTFGFDADSWSTRALREYIANKYSVEYSDGHIRRLLRSFDSGSH